MWEKQGQNRAPLRRNVRLWKHRLQWQQLIWDDLREHERILEQCKAMKKNRDVIRRVKLAVQEKKWELERQNLLIRDMGSYFGNCP